MLDGLGRETGGVSLGHLLYCWLCQCCRWWTIMTTYYRRVAYYLLSHFVLVFSWLVTYSCCVYRSEYVYYCRYVSLIGLPYTTDFMVPRVQCSAPMLWYVCFMQTYGAYLLCVFCSVSTAFTCIVQPFGDVRFSPIGWQACYIMAAKFVGCSTSV